MQPPSSSSLSLFLSLYAQHEADVLLLSWNDFVECFFFEISTRKNLFFFAFFFTTILSLSTKSKFRSHKEKRKKKKDHHHHQPTNHPTTQRSSACRKKTPFLCFTFFYPLLACFFPLLSLYPTRTQRHNKR